MPTTDKLLTVDTSENRVPKRVGAPATSACHLVTLGFKRLISVINVFYAQVPEPGLEQSLGFLAAGVWIS